MRKVVSVIGAIAALVIIYMILGLVPPAVYGAGAALLTIVVAVALLAPLFVDYLVNNPQRNPRVNADGVPGEKGGVRRYRHKWYLFTYLEPGQAKVIQRGERFIRCIMDFPGYRFQREGGDSSHPIPYNDPAHWLIVKDDDEQDPESLYSFGWWNPLGWWVRYMYWLTGVVFTGIPPMQGIKYYQLARWKQKRDEKGELMFIGEGDRKTPLLGYVVDTSDHVRVREFSFPFVAASADTSDQIPVRVTGSKRIQTVNPYLPYYNSDNWGAAVLNATLSKVTAYTRTHTYMALFGAEANRQGAAIELAGAIYGISDDLQDSPGTATASTETEGTAKRYGMKIFGVQITDFEPLLVEAEDIAALRAPFRAERQKEARFAEAEGNAAATVLEAGAIEKGGDAAQVALHFRTQVGVAEAAGRAGGTVIVNPDRITQSIITAENRNGNGRDNRDRNQQRRKP